MKYIIGIDGGGTKTDSVAADLNGNILFETRGNSSNLLIEGAENVTVSVLKLIDKFRKYLKINYNEIEIILVGTAGAGRKTDASKLKSTFLRAAKEKGFRSKNFFVETDARIALEGAFSGKPGAILISGTGSIILGKDLYGNIHRAGGCGRVIGDEGSGYSLGRKGLQAASKELDGRGAKTAITKLLKDKFNISSQQELITQIYKRNFDIASAAPVVISAAEKNDETALGIIHNEIDELLLHISAIKEKINMSQFPLAFIGGLIANQNFYSKILKDRISEKFPEIELKNPDFSPAMGAVLMAKELLSK